MRKDFLGKCESAASWMKLEGEGGRERAEQEDMTTYLAKRCEFLVGRLQVNGKALKPT